LVDGDFIWQLKEIGLCFRVFSREREIMNLVLLKAKKKERKRNYEDGEEHIWFIGWERILTISISKQEENVQYLPCRFLDLEIWVN
jgi:hypothetical protein